MFMVETTPSSVSLSADVAGFSADDYFRSGRMQLYASPATNWHEVNSDRSVYSVDTFPGMSGGPVWTASPGAGRTIRGIHTSEISPTGPGSALNMTAYVLEHLDQWRRQTHPSVDAS